MQLNQQTSTVIETKAQALSIPVVRDVNETVLLSLLLTLLVIISSVTGMP